MLQSEFEKAFHEGMIDAVNLVSIKGGVIVEYKTRRGHQSFIYTKRGDLKCWRTDTCLRWLRGLGVGEVRHDMRGQFLAEQLLLGLTPSLGKRF